MNNMMSGQGIPEDGERLKLNQAYISIQVLIQLHETKYLGMISSSIHHQFEGEIEFHM